LKIEKSKIKQEQEIEPGTTTTLSKHPYQLRHVSQTSASDHLGYKDSLFKK